MRLMPHALWIMSMVWTEMERFTTHINILKHHLRISWRPYTNYVYEQHFGQNHIKIWEQLQCLASENIQIVKARYYVKERTTLQWSRWTRSDHSCCWTNPGLHQAKGSTPYSYSWVPIELKVEVWEVYF